MFKKIFFLYTLLFFSVLNIDANNIAKAEAGDEFGHTFFYVRPQFQTAMPEKESLFRDRINAKCNGIGGAIQIAFFGGRTTKASDLGKFFSPCPKTELMITQTISDDRSALIRDINPIHFGLLYTDGGNLSNDFGQYQSIIKFRPQQVSYGFGFEYRQYLHSRDTCDKNWWLDISAPIYQVKNNMHLEENDIKTEGDAVGPQTMKQAFKGNNFFGRTEKKDLPKYGLINGNQKKIGVADIELRIGYMYTDGCSYQMTSFIGAILPTGNKPKARYVFEPIIGNNFHFGIEIGSYLGFELWQNCDRTINWEFAINSKYYLPNTQRRSFDLKDRRWSRYMLVYEDQDAAQAAAAMPGIQSILDNVTPGINIFTKKMRIHPRYQFNTNTAFIYDTCGFRAEVGYNFWAHQGERVELKENWKEGPAIVNLTNSGSVNLLSNIANDNEDDNLNYILNGENRTIIKATDLDLLSAACPGAFSYTIYLTLGYHWDEICYPTFMGLGISYEFSGRNTAINRWNLWAKGGFSI